VGIADLGHGIGGELTQLTGAQSGAGEYLDHEPVAREPMGARGGHELGGGAVVEELRQRFGSGWNVTVQYRVADRRVGPVPFDEPLEEHPDHA